MNKNSDNIYSNNAGDMSPTCGGATLDSGAGSTSAALFWRRRDLRAGGSSLTADDLLQKADG